MKWILPLFCCSAALAHVGGKVSLAQFTHPPPLLTAPDGGVTAAAIPTADTSYDVTWVDSDSDPTGRYSFFYMDRPPPSGTSTADVAARGIPVGEGPIWSACDCVDDPTFMVMCPDAGDRDCRNGFSFDTSALAEGAYWLIAVDNDPPYYLYSVSESPIRVGHGGTAAPGALFLQPNGIGAADESFALRWVAAGDPPLEFDLAWAPNDGVDATPTSIGKKVAATDEGNGQWSFPWDTSQLADGDVFVQLTTRDAAGRSTVTNSLNLTIFHGAARPDLANAPDLSMTVTPPGDGGCEVAPGGNATAALFVGVVLALLLGALARRSM
jgi:hypothetical protein